MNATGLEAVYDLLGNLLVGDDDDGLGIKALDKVVAHLDKVRTTLRPCVMDDGARNLASDGVDETLSECHLGPRSGPDDLSGAGGILEMAQHGTDAGASAYHHDTPKQGSDAHNTAGWHSPDPHLRRRLVDAVFCPIPCV